MPFVGQDRESLSVACTVDRGTREHPLAESFLRVQKVQLPICAPSADVLTDFLSRTREGIGRGIGSCPGFYRIRIAISIGGNVEDAHVVLRPEENPAPLWPHTC